MCQSICLGFLVDWTKNSCLTTNIMQIGGLLVVLSLVAISLAIKLDFSKPEPLSIGAKFGLSSLYSNAGPNNNIGVIWSEFINNSTWVLKTRAYYPTDAKWTEAETIQIIQGKNYTKEEGIYIVVDKTYAVIVSREVTTGSMMLRLYNGTWSEPMVLVEQSEESEAFVHRITAVIDDKKDLHIVYISKNDNDPTTVGLYYLYRTYRGGMSTPRFLRTVVEDQHIYAHKMNNYILVLFNARETFKDLPQTMAAGININGVTLGDLNIPSNKTDLSAGFNPSSKTYYILNTEKGYRFGTYNYYQEGSSSPLQQVLSKIMMTTVTPAITNAGVGFITLFNVWDGDASSLHAMYTDFANRDGDGDVALVAEPTYCGKDYLNIINDGSNLVHAMWIQPTLDLKNFAVMYSFSELPKL